MLSTDRHDFEGQLAVLFGAYPTFLTPPRVDAYWRGLQKMPLSTFVRCVDQALGETGPDKLPTVNAIWQMSHALRAQAKPPAQQSEVPQFDEFHALGQRSLLKFFMKRKSCTALTESQLQRVIAKKNLIVGQHRATGEYEPAAEWHELLLSAFAKEAA